MTDDELRTHQQFMSDLDVVFRPLIGSHDGKLVKTTGDGFLALFDSAVQAVECAAAMQTRMAERLAALPTDRRMPYRMGINAGDIIVEAEDVYGDDVNIARRLEEMTTPGDVYLTTSVLRYLRGKSSVQVEDLGAHQFKNLSEPSRCTASASAAARRRQRRRKPRVSIRHCRAGRRSPSCRSRT